MTAEPFIRSAGGKRTLAPALLNLFPAPDAYDTYLEPFIGGGAIYYALHNAGHLADTIRIIGDVNPDLAKLYRTVRDHTTSLIREFNSIAARSTKAKDPQKFYEQQRDLWNHGGVSMRTPARQLFLRRSCWNGLWRENKQGHMNTPWNSAGTRPLDEVKLWHAANALQDTVVLDWDFRQYEEDDDFFVGTRTLVFLDPPYLGTDAFTSYTAGGWSVEDTRTLLSLCQTWTSRGAFLAVTHSDTLQFRTLVAELWPEAAIVPTLMRRAINSNPDARGPVSEVILLGNISPKPVVVDAEKEYEQVARTE